MNNSLNILLVEDDDIDAMNIERAFKKANIQSSIIRAIDGLDALELLRAGRIPAMRRIILLDLNMPRMNGLEFLRELRGDKELRRIPVVVLTTSADDADRVAAYDYQVAGYILKPVSFSRFVELMIAFNTYWSCVELP